MIDFIKVDNVSFNYNVEQTDSLPAVLNSVSLDIKEGEFVALLGHNGCGKSTLAKHFNAMLLPTDGTIYIDNISTFNEEMTFEIRSRVGLVLQNPDNQMVASIIEEDVAFGPENLGIEPTEIRKRVDQSLKAVGMYEYRNHPPHKLSGGQKQRISIAGILAMKPKCIVLDEPTAMLDPRGRKEVMETIIKLNHEEKITIILITHNMDEAVKADRVVVMDGGKIVIKGTPKEVFSQVELIKKLKLDVPQATEFAYTLNKLGYDINYSVLDEKECAKEIAKYLGIKN